MRVVTPSVLRKNTMLNGTTTSGMAAAITTPTATGIVRVDAMSAICAEIVSTPDSVHRQIPERGASRRRAASCRRSVCTTR